MALFTKNEQRVVLFLCIGFFVGLCLRIYNDHFRPLPDIATEKPRVIAASVEAMQSGREKASDEQRPGAAASNQTEKIDINRASFEELTQLPGIGEVMARRILDYRNRKGPFQTMPSLLEIKGIGPKKLEKMDNYIIIDSIKEEY